MGVRWQDGDVPKLLVTFNKACSMGLGTTGVVGRPGGDDLVDANGATSWRKRSICVEISLNISGVRVSSPAKNCLMSTVGIPPLAAGISNNSTVGVGSSDTTVDACLQLGGGHFFYQLDDRRFLYQLIDRCFPRFSGRRFFL